jgi:hypothetical protein
MSQSRNLSLLAIVIIVQCLHRIGVKLLLLLILVDVLCVKLFEAVVQKLFLLGEHLVRLSELSLSGHELAV